MSFSDYSIWHPIVQIGIIMVLVLISNTIRRKVGFINRSLIPTPVIGGLLILILRFNPWFDSILEKSLLEAITYHALALGFIAIALKIKPKSQENKSVIVETGAITVSTYLIQGIIGLIITVGLSLTLFKGLFPAAGIILPLGFGQGPGQALNFGTIYENEYGFEGGADFGLAIAGIGFLIACIVGVIYLNYLKRKGEVIVVEQKEVKKIKSFEIVSDDEIPLSESIDKITIQFALVFLSYLLAYLFIYGLSYLATTYLGDFGANTISPLLWGFNFVFGSIAAVLVGVVLKQLRKKYVMTRQYPNNFLLNRISGFVFDIMIVASIGAIEIKMLSKLFIPLFLICLFGTTVTFIYIRYVTHKIYPNYKHEAFFALFGMLSGTASTGMLLLREVDENFETPMANNLVLQNFPAIIFGFPLMILISFAPNGIVQSIITIIILVFMFIVFNVYILRKSLLKKA